MSAQDQPFQLCNLNWPPWNTASLQVTSQNIPEPLYWVPFTGQECHHRLSQRSRPRSTKKGENQGHFHGTVENNPLNLLHFLTFRGLLIFPQSSIISFCTFEPLSPSPNHISGVPSLLTCPKTIS